MPIIWLTRCKITGAYESGRNPVICKNVAEKLIKYGLNEPTKYAELQYSTEPFPGCVKVEIIYYATHVYAVKIPKLKIFVESFYEYLLDLITTTGAKTLYIRMVPSE